MLPDQQTLPLDDTTTENNQPGGDEQLAGQMAGQYVLESLLGRGGVGSVWLARHVDVDSKVAVKVLDGRGEEMRQRLLREARAVNHVNSPHILPISDVGQLADGRHYAMMEVLSGETLAERIGVGCLSWEEIQPIALQIAGALVSAHQAGVIHRDLKPENIFLAEGDGGGQPRVKLLDFGIAEFVDECVQGTSQRRRCPVHGTPLYVAPEQALGEPCGPSADIYAFGVVLYEALSGRPPFVSKSVVEVLVAKNRQVPPSLKDWQLPDVPAVIAELVADMLAIDPEQRPLTTTVWDTILQEGTRLEAAREAAQQSKALQAAEGTERTEKTELAETAEAAPPTRWQFTAPTLDIEDLPDMTAHATPAADDVIDAVVDDLMAPMSTAEIIRPPRHRKLHRPPQTDEAEGVRVEMPRARLPLLRLALALLGGLLFGVTILGAILATQQQRVVSLPPDHAVDRRPVARQLPEKKTERRELILKTKRSSHPKSRSSTAPPQR